MIKFQSAKARKNVAIIGKSVNTLTPINIGDTNKKPIQLSFFSSELFFTFLTFTYSTFSRTVFASTLKYLTLSREDFFLELLIDSIPLSLYCVFGYWLPVLQFF